MALTWDEIAAVLATLPSPEELARLVEQDMREAEEELERRKREEIA